MTKSELLKIAKPILFNTEMVKAILDGRKTVTRRVIKNIETCDIEIDVDGSIVGYYDRFEGRGFDIEDYAPYRKGDILYVRETARIHSMDSLEMSVKLLFKADEKLQEFKVSDEFYEKLSGYSQSKWLSPYYLTKEVARIFLKVTNVRVERLQDITAEQALKEGFNSAYEFNVLWDKTIKKQDLDRYGWEANPWVWVYEFERIEI